jgi:hypothetical protein
MVERGIQYLEDRPDRTSTGHRCCAAMIHRRSGSCRTATTDTCQRNDHPQSRLRADAPLLVACYVRTAIHDGGMT